MHTPINEGTGYTVDDLGFIQLAEAKILAAVARGDLDLNTVGRRELASRGLDQTGNWPARCFIPVGMRVYITVETCDRDSDGCGNPRL